MPAIFVIATLDFIKPMELALHVLTNVRDVQLVASAIHVLIQSTESSLKTALVWQASMTMDLLCVKHAIPYASHALTLQVAAAA